MGGSGTIRAGRQQVGPFEKRGWGCGEGEGDREVSSVHGFGHSGWEKAGGSARRVRSRLAGSRGGQKPCVSHPVAEARESCLGESQEKRFPPNSQQPNS